MVLIRTISEVHNLSQISLSRIPMVAILSTYMNDHTEHKHNPNNFPSGVPQKTKLCVMSHLAINIVFYILQHRYVVLTEEASNLSFKNLNLNYNTYHIFYFCIYEHLIYALGSDNSRCELVKAVISSSIILAVLK